MVRTVVRSTAAGGTNAYQVGDTSDASDAIGHVAAFSLWNGGVMPRLVLALACAVACAVVAGCSASGAPSATEGDTTLPLSTSGWRPGDNRFLAGFHGRVVLTAEGCVIATDGLNLVWPGTT